MENKTNARGKTLTKAHEELNTVRTTHQEK